MSYMEYTNRLLAFLSFIVLYSALITFYYLGIFVGIRLKWQFKLLENKSKNLELTKIMQRRILVVLLPSLEKAPAELTSLGKISLSAIRNACAVGLGANIEGDAADVLEALPTDTIGIGPYLCIVDEYAAIVTPGFEVVLTQGRGLGIAAIVASQDYAGILEADKKGAQQMVANTSIKIFMKNLYSSPQIFFLSIIFFIFSKIKIDCPMKFCQDY